MLRRPDFILKNRQPSMWEEGGFVQGGGLVSYASECRRVATYVDKVLKGAKPVDLPIKQPKTFEMVNLKTANQIGVTIPQ